MSYQKKRTNRLLSMNQSFRAEHQIPSPLKVSKKNPNYSFSEQNSFLNTSNLNRTAVSESRRLANLPKYKPSTSLAEENLVRNFNKFIKVENTDLSTTDPQRIELPLFFNTPYRITTLQKKELKPTQKKIIDKAASNIDSSVFVRSQRRLRDYAMLAFACRRAGKDRDEARAYYSMGVLNDNIGKYKEGIANYRKFLAVCKNVGDLHGEALAYNCIGVNFQIMAQNQNNDAELYKEAIVNHQKHEQLADINGKFLASINLGLCYDFMGDLKSAYNYYQNALRFSIKMAHQVGQTMAYGNLGRIAMKGVTQNEEKMKKFIENYLQLTSQLKDVNGQVKGLLKMGNIQLKNGEFSQGKEIFEKALSLAQNQETNTQLSKAKCGFAIAEVENQIQKCIDDYQVEISTLSPQKLVNY